jgi:hypothetical protein
MPVCIICQGDGIALILNHWYCVHHVDAGFIAVGLFLAHLRGWDHEDTERSLVEWLDS